VTSAVGVGAPGGRDGIPLTSNALNRDGTPTLVLRDRMGRMRMKGLGHVARARASGGAAGMKAE
jgi:hypothetical protein